MSVGKNRHYAIHEIMPRHFLQAAALSGVGSPTMRAIFEGIAGNAGRQAEAVVAALPSGFPHQLVTSIMAAVTHRAGLIADSLSAGAHA